MGIPKTGVARMYIYTGPANELLEVVGGIKKTIMDRKKKFHFYYGPINQTTEVSVDTVITHGFDLVCQLSFSSSTELI